MNGKMNGLTQGSNMGMLNKDRKTGRYLFQGEFATPLVEIYNSGRNHKIGFKRGQSALVDIYYNPNTETVQIQSVCRPF